MADPIFKINTPLINYFIYKDGPKINTPLIAGTIEFFADIDHMQHADTYSDISDPQNPVVNTNPIVLDASGSCPVIYLQDIFYFIVIKSEEGEVLKTYNYYKGASFDGGGITPITIDASSNLLPNGQFTYPIKFYKTSDPIGKIPEDITTVAFGWDFLQNTGSTGNFVYFDDISNEDIEGRPLNQIRITSDISTTQTEKALRAKYGHVTILEGRALTFSCQMINLNTGTIPVIVSIAKHYGVGGSPTVITPIATFNVTTVRNKFVINFTSPVGSGVTIGAGNFESLRFDFPLNQPVSIGITNALLQVGTFLNPSYINQDFSSEKAQILGNATSIDPAGLEQNYMKMNYLDGQYLPVQETGAIVMSATTAVFPDKLKIDDPGQTLNIGDYSEKNIPYRRLYNVIGETYGGGGTGTIIATSSGNIVTFKSIIGMREKSAYTAGTSGFTVTNTVQGLKYGLDLVVNPGSEGRIVTMTWLAQFAAAQTTTNIAYAANGNIGNYFYITFVGANPPSAGNKSILTTNISAGSPITSPSSTINFSDNNISNYKSYNQKFNNGLLVISVNVLEFSFDSSNNVRYTPVRINDPPPPPKSPIMMRFQVDGQFGDFLEFTPGGALYTIDFNMLSGESIAQNVARFVHQVANPFEWQVVIPSAPTPGSYFLFSSGPQLTGTDYYAWYRVNGSGTDPAVPSRTGIMIDILSTDNTTEIARKTAEGTSSSTFKLPTPGVHLPSLPSPLTSYFINL